MNRRPFAVVRILVLITVGLAAAYVGFDPNPDNGQPTPRTALEIIPAIARSTILGDVLIEAAAVRFTDQTFADIASKIGIPNQGPSVSELKPLDAATGHAEGVDILVIRFDPALIDTYIEALERLPVEDVDAGVPQAGDISWTFDPALGFSWVDGEYWVIIAADMTPDQPVASRALAIREAIDALIALGRSH